MLRLALVSVLLMLALSPVAAQAEPATDDPAAPGAGPVIVPVASANAAPRYGVAEAFRRNESTELGITWERDVFSWAGIQPNGSGEWRADLYFSPEVLQRERDRGFEIVGVLQFTPLWAAERPEDGHRSPPKNLAEPAESPDNPWARFAGRMASHYKGRIDNWIIWNEPEFKPGDRGAGDSYTWSGSDEEYYLLLKRAYQAIKAANPGAAVVFGGTSYWVDVNAGRRPFFQRLLDLMAADPEAPANNWFFDAVDLNLYWCPDDLLRVSAEVKAAMRAKGIEKPLWLTETNAMPYDDTLTPKEADGQRVPLQVQADYVLQSMALAAAAGWERYGWYRIDDGQIWEEQEVWGLIRDDGSKRPAFDAVKVAARLFGGAGRVSFVPLEREGQPYGTPWPYDPNSYYPNWQVYQVVFDHADGRRVTALWNGDGRTLRVRVPKRGSGAVLADRTGAQRPLSDTSGWYVVDLPPATVRGAQDPEAYHYVGGPVALLVEQGVPAGAPVEEPRLGNPGSAEPGLKISLDPPALKFWPGESVPFVLRLRGIEGFDARVQLSVSEPPAGLRVEIPTTARPGERAPIVVHADRRLKPNLYVLTVTAAGGGAEATTEMLLEVVAP